MENIKKKKNFLKFAQYPGGKKVLEKFITEHLVYPKEALENKIEGTVFVRYSIDNQGFVDFTEVDKGIGFGCDEEALRVVKLLKYAKPKNRGVRVRSFGKINIHFRLPKPQSVSYSYSLTDKNEKKDEKKTENSYSYTLKF